MAYPNVIYGDFGDEKLAQSAKIGGLPLGQLMILPDGRKFRHAKAGGTALEAGVIVSATAGLAGDGNVAASGLIASATVSLNKEGDTDVFVATSLTTFTLAQFEDGYMGVQGPAASSYIGHLYAVKTNAAAASVQAGGDLQITLQDKDGLKEDWAAGSTFVSLRKNPFVNQIIAASIKTITGSVPVAVSASFYFWCQRSGPASVQTAATTVTDGAPVAIGKAQAGSVTLFVAVSGATQHQVGQALETVSAADAGMIDLNLE